MTTVYVKAGVPSLSYFVEYDLNAWYLFCGTCAPPAALALCRKCLKPASCRMLLPHVQNYMHIHGLSEMQSYILEFWKFHPIFGICSLESRTLKTSKQSRRVLNFINAMSTPTDSIVPVSFRLVLNMHPRIGPFWCILCFSIPDVSTRIVDDAQKSLCKLFWAPNTWLLFKSQIVILKLCFMRVCNNLPMTWIYDNYVYLYIPEVLYWYFFRQSAIKTHVCSSREQHMVRMPMHHDRNICAHTWLLLKHAPQRIARKCESHDCRNRRTREQHARITYE